MKKMSRILACLLVVLLCLGLTAGGVWANGNDKVKGKEAKAAKEAVLSADAETAEDEETEEGEETEPIEIQAKNHGQAKKLENRVKVRGMNLKFDIPPVIKEGRTLIPVRAIMNGLGADVAWDDAAKTVTITKGDKTIVLNLADGTVTVNGEAVTVDVPAQIISNRTFVPLRFIAETIGEKVDYDEETGEIDIGEEEEPADEEDEEDEEEVTDEEDEDAADEDEGTADEEETTDEGTGDDEEPTEEGADDDGIDDDTGEETPDDVASDEEPAV